VLLVCVGVNVAYMIINGKRQLAIGQQQVYKLPLGLYTVIIRLA